MSFIWDTDLTSVMVCRPGKRSCTNFYKSIRSVSDENTFIDYIVSTSFEIWGRCDSTCTPGKNITKGTVEVWME